jgi:hypothetical protein
MHGGSQEKCDDFFGIFRPLAECHDSCLTYIGNKSSML